MTELPDPLPTRSFAYVWDGALLYAPASIANSLHAHFAATVLIAVDTPFHLTLEDGSRQAHEIALLSPNVVRGTDSGGRPLVDFLIDPDDPLYCYLCPLLQGRPVASLPGELLQAFMAQFADIFAGNLGCADARRLLEAVLQALCPAPLAELPWDERVQRANRYMRDCLPDHVPGIPEVAAEVGLSESRFMHLFREQMGLPVRQYLLWLRIRHAMRFWAEGQSLSEIALAAGFYDQAHFTRTIRRMTDYAPSMISDPDQVVRHYCECG